MIISDCSGENMLKLVNRNQRYYKNKSGTGFLVHSVHRVQMSMLQHPLHKGYLSEWCEEIF